ncbi:IS231B transposase [Bacillus thuringiensis HD-771]|uniref:IS231B transposase n=1 Tax=Bacillus thuringiensis HD-771 TaxID=1218175 RepID=A0A9W3NV92_BACTU|nr:IS231B transposase [Bacillus thuringiensis HD-771]
MKYSARSKRLSGINVYMTNTPTDIVPMGQVHDWYSLRWQIEILFKTWKSLWILFTLCYTESINIKGRN